MDKLTNRIFATLDRLTSGHLLMVLGGIFLLDLLVPDPLPFVDEAVLGVLTLLAARWKMRVRDEPQEPPPHKPPPKNVTPSESPHG